MGFPKQEYWSGLPLPLSPKCSAVLCLVTQSCPTLCNPMDWSPPGSSVHGDSPGENTGMGCHALPQGTFPTEGSNPGLCDLMDCSLPGSSVHEDSPGKSTGVDCHALLQGSFSTQGSNPGLPHCRWILYHLSHQGNSRILEWVAYPFSSGSS